MDKDLIKILCCPDDKADVELKNNSLKCIKCNRIFEIRNGVPVMLPKTFY
ncbi:MAG: Trm112 family protein [Candidatus Woesearchaeota archaeon]|jgi:uncharacterized protein YbaR (Trm112 family)